MTGTDVTIKGAMAEAETAQATAQARLASISGDAEGGVTIQFSTDSSTKAVTTTIAVAESTLDADSKFGEDDKNVATGAKVQEAIDAAEARAKEAQTYTADGTTIALANNNFSAITAPVASTSAALTTGAQVATAIGAEATRATGVEDAIKTDIGAWSDGSKYASSTVKGAIETLSAISMFKVVQSLPETGETNTIYIVKPAGQEHGPYEEYIWVNNAWEKIGDTDIQLQNYYTKAEVGSGFNTANTVKDYIDGLTDGLDTRLDAVEGKMPANDKTVDEAIAVETARAEGVEGDLDDLTTDAKTSLVAAINEVDAHADAANAAIGVASEDAEGSGTIYARIADVRGVAKTAIQEVEAADMQGEGVTVTISKYTEGTRTIFVEVQSATIDRRGIVQLSSTVSATAEDVAATPKGVSSAVSAAKTELIGTGLSDSGDTIKKAQATAAAAASAAQAEATARKADVSAILGGTKHAVGTVLELAVTEKSGVSGTFSVTGVPSDVTSYHIVRVEWNHEDFMCMHTTDGDIVMWDASATVPTGATMPEAKDIKVFALVTGTSSTPTA